MEETYWKRIMAEEKRLLRNLSKHSLIVYYYEFKEIALSLSLCLSLSLSMLICNAQSNIICIKVVFPEIPPIPRCRSGITAQNKYTASLEIFSLSLNSKDFCQASDTKIQRPSDTNI